MRIDIIKIRLLFFSIMGVALQPLNAQQQISTSTLLQQQKSVQEKIFVHTDKSFYTAGEMMWFKLYNVDAGSHRPINLSKVAYVDLLDTSHQSVLKAKIILKDGCGNGTFYIPLTVNSGVYQLRAYTNWMKNEGPDVFFEKNITLVNTQKTSDVQIPANDPSIDLQFFPEGGNLVYNLQSRVAFKAVNGAGDGISFKAALTDNGDTLLTFTPLYNGMGSFYFTPQQGHVYKAYVYNDNAGKVIAKELPKAYEAGYVMQVTSKADKVLINVTGDKTSQPCYLLAHTRGINKVLLKADMQQGAAVFSIDKTVLGDGISHLTLFNSQQQPLCERLYFKMPKHKLSLDLSTEKNIYTRREKVNLKAAASTLVNDTANLSMSVYLIDSLQPVDDNYIEAYLLLSSELKGNIHHSSYYFTDIDSVKEMALDNLLLTQGWRRFKWNDHAKQEKKLMQFIPEYNGHIVTGRIYDASSGQPAANIETWLSAPGLATAFTTAISNNKGALRFEMKKLVDTQELMVQPANVAAGKYRIEIDDPFDHRFTSTTFPSFRLPSESPATLLKHSISMQVQNIYTGDSLQRFYPPAVDTTAFYVSPDAKYMLDDFTRFTTLEEVVREYVTLVTLRKNDGRFHLNVFDLTNNVLLDKNPLLLLDGVPLQDLHKFMSFDPLKIKKLEVVNRKYMLGASTFDGIFNWTTYNGDLAGYELDPNIAVIDYEGLQAEREFYQPLYDTPEKMARRLPDFRNVLLWQPEILLQDNSTKQLSFYTSDLPGKYVVVLQGLSKAGLFGSTTMSFEVRK